MKNIVSILLCLSFLFTGCEAFRKKFVRKPKRQREIEVIVETEEYETKYSQEQIYAQYFSFWKAAHEELVDLLDAPDENRKRLQAYAKRIIDNLLQMRQLLAPEKQMSLDVYILKQKEIAGKLEQRKLSRAQKLQIKSTLKKQKRQIQQEFTCSHIFKKIAP